MPFVSPVINYNCAIVFQTATWRNRIILRSRYRARRIALLARLLSREQIDPRFTATVYSPFSTRESLEKFCPGRNWWLVNDPMFSRAFHSQHFKSTSNPILRSFHVSGICFPLVGEKWRRRKRYLERSNPRPRNFSAARQKFSCKLSLHAPTIFPRAGKTF